MRKTNAFLLVEVLVALGVFAVCALSIAFSITALRVHYLKTQEQRKVLIHIRNNLEQLQDNSLDVFLIHSVAFMTFLRARGVSNIEPFYCKKIEVQLKGKHANTLALVGII